MLFSYFTWLLYSAIYLLLFSAAPIYLHITSDATSYTELTNAVFTCSGNVGRPLGSLRLLRANDPSHSDYFLVEEFVSSTDLDELLGPSALLPNGTYYVSYTFYRNMTRHDNGTFFICDIVHEVPSVSTTKSNQVAVSVDCKYIMFLIVSSFSACRDGSWRDYFIRKRYV